MHAYEYLQLKRKNWIIGLESLSQRLVCLQNFLHPCTFQSQLALIAALKFWKQIFILLLTLTLLGFVQNNLQY